MEDRLTIVCVDDEETVLASLRRQLRACAGGHRIEVAQSGPAVLELMERLENNGRPVALLLSDQQMPGMTGDAVLSAAAARFPHTYQVMLTGQATAEAVGRAVNQGRLYRFLSKPWTSEDLSFTVTKALEAYQRDRELERQRAALDRAYRRSLQFVPHAYLRMLGRARLEDAERGDAASVRVSVAFADIRGFTTLIERMDPHASFDLVNRYCIRTEPAILAHGGFVDTYAGDGTMAIFPGSVAEAVAGCVAFSHAVDAWNAERKAAGEAPIEIGIGLHSGDVIVGVRGGEHALQCGVIGDAVNAAARLEGIAARYGTRLIVSDTIGGALPAGHGLSLRPLERVRVKGKTAVIAVCEVLDALPPAARDARRATLETFHAAAAAAAAGDVMGALAGFAQVVAADPSDRAAHVLLDTCHARLRGRAAVDADGVVTLDEKRF